MWYFCALNDFFIIKNNKKNPYVLFYNLRCGHPSLDVQTRQTSQQIPIACIYRSTVQKNNSTIYKLN